MVTYVTRMVLQGKSFRFRSTCHTLLSGWGQDLNFVDEKQCDGFQKNRLKLSILEKKIFYAILFFITFPIDIKQRKFKKNDFKDKFKRLVITTKFQNRKT